MTDPTGRQVKYDFVTVAATGNFNLASVTYPVEGDPAGEKTYFYNEQNRTRMSIGPTT